MAHPVDGFDLTFTSRTRWKAIRKVRGRKVDIIPVTWTKGWRKDPGSGENRLEVWYQDPAELESRSQDPSPFVVALAIAKDYSVMPHAFQSFQGVFEVAPTGTVLSKKSLETRVLKRVLAE